MESESVVIVWLVFTQKEACCGKKRVVRRLVEYNVAIDKITALHNLERGRKVYDPPESQIKGRKYCRLYELAVEIREPFMAACQNAGAIPNGVNIS